MTYKTYIHVVCQLDVSKYSVVKKEVKDFDELFFIQLFWKEEVTPCIHKVSARVLIVIPEKS